MISQSSHTQSFLFFTVLCVCDEWEKKRKWIEIRQKEEKKTDQSSTHICIYILTLIFKHSSIHTRTHTHIEQQTKIYFFQSFLVKLFSAAIFFICFKRFSKSKPVAILVFVPVVDDGELLPELLLPELFKRLNVGCIVVDGGDLTTDGCRPSGVGELTRCRFLDVGNNFWVDFNDDDDDDSWGFNTGGEDGLVDFKDEREDELVVFNDPVVLLLPFIDCFNKGFNDDDDVGVVNDLGDGGERFVLLLLLGAVNAVSSASIEVADELELVNSDVVFFSLNPVANEAHPLVFFVVVPLVNEEVELDIDGLLDVVLSDVFESDD